MPSYTWSYSSLDLFKQCPHKYYRLRIKKDVKDPPNPSTNYGLRMHKVAEEYILNNAPIPEDFKYLEPTLQVLRSYKGDKYSEYRMGLTRNLEPCAFFAKDVWWRGTVDYLCVNDDLAIMVDYKTGKTAKYADTKQLEILSLAVFKHFPTVRKVRGGLLFVVSKDFIKDKYEVANSPKYWQRWLTDTAQLEKTLEANVWNPRPNFTCRKYCPVTDCIHNGG